MNASHRQDDGFCEKYDRYADMLYRIAATHVGNRHDAEEVLQEAFIRLLYHAPRFEGEEHEKAWLIRVTINLCKNRLRNPFRKCVSLLEQDAADPLERDNQYLLQEVMNLPVRFKSVIHLYYYEDYSVPQIARILCIGQSAVKMRLKRGRQLLKMELEGEDT